MNPEARAILNCSVLFCSAACIPANDSFTMDLHPDVGEGAGPQPVRPGRAFYLPARLLRARTAMARA
jgi:hypothetical protein